MSFVGPNVWGITQSNVLFKNAKKWERQKSSAMLALSLSRCLQTTSKELRHPKRKQVMKWHGILEHYTENRPPHWIRWQLKVVVGGWWITAISAVFWHLICSVKEAALVKGSEANVMVWWMTGQSSGRETERGHRPGGRWGRGQLVITEESRQKSKTGQSDGNAKKKKAASAVSLESRWKPGEL